MKPFLRVFRGEIPATPPCWFMRQAGRYLPEYRELREKAGDFLTMCYTPDLAREVTLQPIRRFGMDAAIIFSDILVVPHGLGRPLTFTKGQGPWLEPILGAQEVEQLDVTGMTQHLHPVYEALRTTRAGLPEEVALIGFAGAPWTLLCYMMDGNGKQDFIEARSAIYRDEALVERLMDVLVGAVGDHLIAQIDAGAEAVQLFDSWAAHVPATHRDWLVYEPAAAIVARIHRERPGVPVICFPRGIGMLDYCVFAETVMPDGLSVDQFTPIEDLSEALPAGMVIQGNLDPLALVHDLHGVCAQAQHLREALRDRPYIANLGHGVLPSTPPEHMKELIRAIRQ